MKRKTDIENLKAELLEKESEIQYLHSELVEATERGKELEEVRRAMLYMLEDLNKSGEAIAKSQKEWLDTVDAFSDPLFVHDSEYKIVRANRAYAEEAGAPFKELIGRPYFEVFPRMDSPFNACVKTNEPLEGEEIFYSPSGKIYRVRFFPTVTSDGVHKYSTHIMEDVTESRKEEERKTILDNFNQRMIADIDKGYRYRELCKAVIGLGYKMAWVGELDHDTKEVIPIAEEGFEEGYLSTIKVKFDDSPLGEGPTGRAIKNGRMEIFNNIGKNPEYKPWRDAATKRGYGSSAAFPLITEDIVTGVLNVYNKGALFPEADAGFLRDLASRAAVYIRNSELFKEVSDSKDKIRQEMSITGDLLMIAEATSGKTDLDKFMADVANCCQRLMKSDICLSYIYDHDEDRFKPSQAAGLSFEELPLFRTEHLAKDAWFLRDAIVEKRACSFSGPFEKEAMNDTEASLAGETLKWLKGARKLLVIPLVGRIDSSGFLLTVYRDEKEFSDRDYEIADGMSFQISTALEEARLYRDSIDKALDLSHKIETIRVMHEIDKSILSVLNKNELLETVVGLVGKVVPCDRSIAFLVDKGKEGFTYVAGGDKEAKGVEFIPFADTSASEAVKLQRPLVITDLKGMKKMLPFDDKCSGKGCTSAIRYPLITKGEVSALLCIGSNRTAAFTPGDLSTLEKLASQIGVAMENSRLVSDLEELFLGTVKTLSSAIDAKSPWTAGHSGRVTTYALSIGAAMNLSETEMKELELAGLLHDIGKIGVYESILDKPGKLTDEEFNAIRQHPSIGAELLTPIKQLNKNVIPAARYHHERFDGKGYPDGLKGEEIPLMARILSVADTYDAMKADRPYRTGRTDDFILEEFDKCSGTQFDPEIIDIFFTLHKKEWEQ